MVSWRFSLPVLSLSCAKSKGLPKGLPYLMPEFPAPEFVITDDFRPDATSL